ncbi:MAG: hypothetical protein JSW34_05085 [Candidatus Zixiibacteriota bacterium]|nr:MAG: hypothetical protein JSW34_05085 [candidate division Zixibacteria bacterium]
MKLTRVLSVAILILLIASSASAFDGLRKGFVLGGGLGMAPVVRTSIFDADDSRGGVGLHIVIGYAWDEYNMIVYESNVAGAEAGRVTYAQGFGGPAWYHYFGPQGKSFFTVVGLGFYSYQIEDEDLNDSGGGYLIGGGYEFARHFQVAMYLSGGKTELLGLIDMGHNNLSILISAVAF